MNSSSSANPFLFLEPYGLKDHYRLKGRDEETAALLALLKWKDIIVVFGKSGIGKTSFINYTLSDSINRVSWLPIRITRLLNINESLKMNLIYALNAKSVHEIHDDKIDISNLTVDSSTPVSSKEILELVEQLYKKWNRAIYLIIDQLEELFLVGNTDEQNTFLQTLQLLMESGDLQKKIILVLREEHLVYIQDIECILNGVFQDALSIKKIDKSHGEKIFKSLFEYPKLEISPEMEFFKETIYADNIRNIILGSCSSADAFDAQRLQVILFLLWEEMFNPLTDINTVNIDSLVNRVCNSSDPLKDYLDQTVNTDLSKNARLLMARYWFVIRNAVSDANTKKPVSKSELYTKLLAELTSSLSNSNSLSSQTRHAIQNMTIDGKSLFQVEKDQVKEWCEDLVREKILEIVPAIGVVKNGEQYFQLKHDTLVAAIRALDTGLPVRFPRKVSPDVRQHNPYQGLDQYGYDESFKKQNKRLGMRDTSPAGVPRLYGRDSIIKEYTEFLQKQETNCLVVVGDSGTGKSSLVKGGILPAMQAAGFETRTMQPGPDLERFRRQIGKFIDEQKNEGVNTPNNLKRCLYIDQFEECYTFRESTSDEKKSFSNFLGFLINEVEKRDSTFKLIVSIRHDYAHEFDRNIEQWREFKKLLRYPNQEEIFDIIVSPAYDRGIDFSEKDLPEKIAGEAANTSYFLPLLSFTMQTLYDYDVKSIAQSSGNGAGNILSTANYLNIGGIVKCLQQEFTKTYNELKEKENKELFIELMTRMIVIKDTIPKAQPLAESRINYPITGKANSATKILEKFDGKFFRKRNITINGVNELCYEPIHDSLLVYCEEIRYIINNVQVPTSQMYLQARIESAVKEWKKSKTDLERVKRRGVVESENSNAGADNTALTNINTKIIDNFQKRFKELSPIYDMVDDEHKKNNNWLFTEEKEYIEEGKNYAESFRGAEKLVIENQLRKLEFEKKENEIVQKQLQAEHARAEEEAKKKEQELSAMTYKASYESQKRLNWIIILLATAMLTGIIAVFWYKKNAHAQADLNERDSLVTALNKLLTTNKDEKAKLLIEQTKGNLANKKLRETLVLNTTLIDSLKQKESDLNNNIAKLSRIRDQLTSANNNKTLALAQVDSINTKLKTINDELIATVNQLHAASAKVDSLRNERVNTLAKLYMQASPALSYRLAESALQMRTADPVATELKSSLESKPRYFETLIIDSATSQTVSSDGSRLVVVQDNKDVNSSNIKIWDVNSGRLTNTIKANSKINITDISPENNKIIVGDNFGIRLVSITDHQLDTLLFIPTLLYAQFAENSDRFFAISNNRIKIFGIDGIGYRELKNIRFDNDGIVNKARLSGNDLIVITPKGITHFDVEKGKQSYLRKLPQSFILNNGGNVLAMEKPLLGKYRNLVLFDTKLHEIWSKKVPDKSFNLITQFINSNDGQSGIIQFNQREQVVQYAQQQMQEQQQIQQQKNARQLLKKELKTETRNDLDVNNLYLIDLPTGNFKLLKNGNTPVRNFILSARNDSLFEFSSGSIRKLPINTNTDPDGELPSAISIGENTRFKKLSLAGLNNNFIVTQDAAGQVKLWKYGNAATLEREKQLWQLPKSKLEFMMELK